MTWLRHTPQVKSLITLANKGTASHRLARKEFYPDFNLSFEYMFREASMNDPGYNMFSLGVTFNLPFSRKDAGPCWPSRRPRPTWQWRS